MITGACPCGALSFSIDGPAAWTVYCHCGECRDASGAPVTLWAGFPVAAVAVSGVVSWRPGRSLWVTRGFCAVCGAHVLYRDRSMVREELYINGAFVSEPDRVVAEAHAFWSERVTGVGVDDRLPTFDTYSRLRLPRTDPADIAGGARAEAVRRPRGPLH